MKNFRVAAAALVTATISAATLAATPATRYRVTEVANPSAASSACLAGYARRSSGTGINDLGVASANFSCFTSADTTNNVYGSSFHPFVAAAHIGSYELPLPAGVEFADIVNIDDRLQGFGSNSSADHPLHGVRYTLGGGTEDVFTNPADCAISPDLNYAQSGNAHGYVIGWVFDKDITLPPPLDTFCFTLEWAIRTPAGAQVKGPLNGSANDINALDVAVGTVGTGAVKLQLPSGRQQVLDAGDAGRNIDPVDINDLGEVAGFANLVVAGSLNPTCGPSIALRWERDGRERTLSNLPGQLSARAWAVGYDGEAVGESGLGNYCDPNTGIEDQRAVIWKGTQAINLNSLIPASENITLMVAAEVNRRGQIVATGYRNGEARLACPDYRLNTDTGFYELDPAYQCHNTYVYVLTPAGR